MSTFVEAAHPRAATGPARQGTVTLGQLGDPRLVLESFWASTNEVIDEAGASAFGAEWIDEITLKRRRWAVSTSPSWSRTWTACSVNRQPQGVPAGGEFAAAAHFESNVTLSRDDVIFTDGEQ